MLWQASDVIYIPYENSNGIWGKLLIAGMIAIVCLYASSTGIKAVSRSAVIAVGAGIVSLLVVVISWIFAVTFAFFTNKKYVFKNETKTRKEFWTVFASFYGARLATFVVEELMFVLLCDILHLNKTIITFASQVIIFIANYVLSKLFVFRNKKEDKSE
ncbi:MAG: GtrA family protein [Ruminococcus sp.]|nr:GtrA family protein [Ruminococcus sp.]